MYSVNPLRAEAEAICTGLRRSRGEELYIARKMCGIPTLLTVSNLCEGIISLIPSSDGIKAMRSYIKQHAESDVLYERFENAECADEDMELICRGVKLLENALEGKSSLYDREVRRRCARVLRECSGYGGGLDICRMIVIKLEGLKEK